jgi:NADH:ubiquinone oxidoreductase subunit 2 (subunit N)
LAGLPPFPGFFSKLFLVYTLWLKGEFFYSFSIMLISVLSAVYYIS